MPTPLRLWRAMLIWSPTTLRVKLALSSKQPIGWWCSMAGLVILDHLGRVVATAPERREWLGLDWSSLSFFQQMMHSTGAAYSDILPGEPAEVGVAVPILGDRGEWRGTLVGLFQLGTRSISALYGGIVRLRINDGGNTYLVDSTGRAIYHSNEELIGADLGTSPMVHQVLNNQTGSLHTRDAAGRDILASFAPIPGTPWGLISEEQWSDLLSATQGYGQFLVVLLALGVIVPTLVVTIGVKRITDPIAQLIAAAQEIASGQFGQQITVRTGDELEEARQTVQSHVRGTVGLVCPIGATRRGSDS